MTLRASVTVLLTLCATTLGCSADSDDTETGGDEAAATDGTGSGPDSGGDDDGGDDSPGTGTNEGDGQDDAPDDGGEAPSDTAGTTGGETGTDSDSDTDPDTGTEAGSDDGSGMSAGSVDVMLSGCDVDFSGDIVVTYNGSLGVASVADQGGTLTGSFQFDLDGPATFALSTQHRVDTGTVINLVDPGQGTWTNLDPDSFGSKVDAVGGTLDVSVWTPSEGMAVIEFSGVSLVNVTTGNVCTIDGTVETEELYP